MAVSEGLPKIYARDCQRMVQALAKLTDCVVSAHVNPDGDAVGSMLCAGLLLQAFGIRFAFYASTGIPEFLRFLTLPAPVFSTLHELPFVPKTAFFVDCGEYHRLGGDLEALAPTLPSINVDHHEGLGMGSLASWVVPNASATTELLAYMAMAAHLPLRGLLAKGVGLGLITDTGGFAHANTSAACLALMTHLAKNGLNIALLREEIENSLTLARMHLWGRLAQKISLSMDGSVAICAVSQEDFCATKSSREDVEGYVEYLRKLKGVLISAIVREDGANLCKLSLRSKAGIDLLPLCKTFQGGGHRNACGATLHMPLQEALHKVQRAVDDFVRTFC